MKERIGRWIDQGGLIVLMTVSWVGLAPSVNLQTIGTGFILSLVIRQLVATLFHRTYRVRTDLAFIGSMLVYLKNLIIAMIRSSLTVLPVILKRSDEPIIFQVHLTTSDRLVVLLVANAITLTPGTITLDASQDNVLTVLSLVDDGAHGLSLTTDILNQFNKPFEKAMAKGENQ